MKITKYILLATLLLSSALAQAKLQVITTLVDLASIAKEVGGDDVQVDAIARGTQDPHYIEAKPSYMVKANHADLVISVGLGLEVGWLPPILRGARNPKLSTADGALEVGPLVNPIEVPSGSISRAQGDVHPEGNPHVTLDPERAGIIAEKIAERFGTLDEAHKAQYADRAKKFKDRLAKKLVDWKARVAKSGVKEVVTFHKTLNYFLKVFNISVPIELEPKPGIPPTSNHILEVIKVVKDKKIPLIMVENFFDHTVANRIQQDVPSVRVVSVPASVDGDETVKTLDDLYEKLVRTIEGK